MIDFTKIKSDKIDINNPKIKQILEDTQKAIQKSIEQGKKSVRFPF